MSAIESERALTALLSECEADATRRTAKRLDGLRISQGVVVFGAGTLGRIALASLRHLGVRPIAFVDDTPEKHGTDVDGVPVHPVAWLSTHPSAVVIVTISSPRLPFTRARSYVRSFTDAPVHSYVELSWKYPAVPRYYQFSTPAETLRARARIREAFALLADDLSRDFFVQQVRFRLRLEYDDLPTSAAVSFLSADVVPVLTADVTFVDGGAYDGDTIREFLDARGDRFASIIAFEPDTRNFELLRQYADTLPRPVANRIRMFQAAVGAERGSVAFQDTGDMGARIHGSGNIVVPVLPLDEVIDDEETPLVIKLDVEGAERAALAGAARTIGTRRPILAVAVYHEPDDLWEIPLEMRAFNDAYEIFVRPRGPDGMDFCCYAR